MAEPESKESVANLGAPKDAPVVTDFSRGSLRLNTGDNNDQVSVSYDSNVNINTGRGRDHVIATAVNDGAINLGPDDDTMVGKTLNNVRINATQGKDIVTLKNSDVMTTVDNVRGTVVTDYLKYNRDVVVDGNSSTHLNVTDGTKDSYLNGGGNVNLTTPNRTSVQVDKYGDSGYKISTPGTGDIISARDGGNLTINGQKVDLGDLPKTLQLSGMSGGSKEIPDATKVSPDVQRAAAPASPTPATPSRP